MAELTATIKLGVCVYTEDELKATILDTIQEALNGDSPLIKSDSKQSQETDDE